ncbi:Spy0128 family protein [Streptococcus intermedius]|uniref:Spy0128 family protein n=1 Tax=Streptococcus intermedius TaxID=1338 RepID=UPI000E3C56F1|nr:FctA domain-containing protein [Streptococcus intermedius]
MKARQKLMSLLGVTLLLASTILTPISTVVAQTQNSTQTSQTTSGSKEVSKEQAQQSSSTTNTGDKSKQSPKGAESSKSNKTEEKSETQPGAPPRSKRTRRAAPAGALDVKEVEANFTDFNITDSSGKPLQRTVEQWENFRITANFSLPSTVRGGDKTTIKLPDKLMMGDTSLTFDLKDAHDQVVAKAVADPKTKTITLTYTDYVNNHSDIKGSFFFYARVDDDKVQQAEDIDLTLTINNKVVVTKKKVRYRGPNPPYESILEKSGWRDPDDKTLFYYGIPINRSQKNLGNVIVKDRLANSKLKIVKDSLKVYEVNWFFKNGKYGYTNAKDVTSSSTIKLDSDESGFSVDLGKVGNKGYYIKYKVKVSYTPVDGEIFKNNATLLQNGQLKYQTSFSLRYLAGGGKAEGYVYSVKIHKKDDKGNKLQGAEFELTRDSTGEVKTVTTDTNGNAEIKDLLKDNYTLRETKAPNGYKLSNEEIKIKPSDFGADKVYKKEVINKKDEKVSAQLQVKKELIGRQLKDKEFTFELKRKSDQHLEETVQNDGAGLVKFKELTFTEVGTYEYIISEKREDHPEHGLFYDISDIAVTVTVGRDNEGKLAVTKISYKEQGSSTEKKTFTNTYTPDKTETRLSVNKKLTGRSLREGEFQFELKKEGDQTPLQTKSNDADGKVQFDSIEYDKAGTYNYTITEKAGNVPGVVYEPNLISATVVVEDKGGKLQVTEVTYSKTGKKTDNPTFVNQYTPGKTFARLEVKKVLTGRNLQNGEFEFELTGTEDHQHQVKTNDANGKVEFDQIEYTKAGEYHYTIKEKNNSLGGITYDPKEVKATVKVTDDGNGQLVAQVSYDTANPTFRNTYLAKETTATLEANKVLTGRELKANEFAFDLIDPNGEVVDTAKNAKDGKISFKELTFKTAGTYTYTIKEQAGALGGVKYDTKVIKATVTVTDDGKGQLHATVAYENNQNTFTNTYSADKATATLSAKKLLEGRNLKEGEFEFELTGTDDQVRQTKTNAQDGSVTFDTIEYTKMGTYHYTITEKDTKLGGVKYDTKVIKATVTVTDDGQGHLVTKVAYEKDDQTFKNTYSAAKTNAQLSVKKALTGRALKDGEFEFELKGQDDQVRQTKTNAQDGSVTFDTIEYTKTGTYHYTITEKNTKLGGVTYDKKVIKATVTVTDNGQGQLVAQVAYEQNDQTFTNQYQAAPTTAQLSANKQLTGRDLKAGEFSFELKNDKDEVLETVTNDKDGKITFKTLTYTAVGTYQYTITEKDTKLGGVKYDTKVIKATVTVTDNGAGKLVATVSYDTKDRVFNNTYTPDPVPATIGVTKKLIGRALKANEFEFVLKDEKGRVLQTKKNAADGSVNFDALEYNTTGTYHYTIAEKNTKLQGITYDKKVIKVTVTVTDDANGHLVAKVSYDKNIKTFENRYTPPKKGLPKTGTVIHTLAIFIGLIVLAGAVYLMKKKS